MYYASANGVRIELDTESIDEAKNKADIWISYCQANLYIDEGDEDKPIAMRRWYGIEPDEDAKKTEAIITFGEFGYYGPWEMFADVEADMRKPEPEELDDELIDPADLDKLVYDDPPPFIIPEDYDCEVDYSPAFLEKLDAEGVKRLLEDEKELLNKIKKRGGEE